MTRDSSMTGGFDPLDGIIAEYLQAAEAGTAPPRDELLARHPELADRLRAFFADFDGVGRDASKFRLPDPQETVTVGGGGRADLPRVRYLGDYELVGEIARGGMGVVYRARQVSLNRTVALKMILAGTYATDQAVQRFRAEAEAAANLDHPHILPIYEVGEHDGHQYFSMKLVEGGSLSAKIDELKSQPKQVAALMTTLARAVHFAHQRGILHRDLKPGNILLDADGTPYVTDFGLAKKVDADDGSTRTGAVVGTPSYMAPEQARGEKGLTTAVDLYSLGAILYELLAGVPPFRGEGVFDTLRQVMEVEPSTPPGDRDLGVIALKCLSKDPAKRYASAGEMADDLERWQRGEAITARPVGKVEKFNKWVRRNKAITALGCSFLLAVCFGIGMSIRAAGEADRRAIAAEASEAILKLERDETARAYAAREVSEKLAQSRLYGSQIRLAQSASDQLQVGQAKRALDDTDPSQRGWEYYHLRAAADTSYRTVKLTRSATHHLALSPDGKTLGYTDSSDSFNSLKLAKDAREVDRLSTSSGGFSWAYGLPVGRAQPCCVYAEDQRSLYLFAVDGLKHVRFDDGNQTVFGHANPDALKGERTSYMGALAFSTDRKKLYSAGRGKLTCWNRDDLKEVWSTPIAEGECWALAVSADDTRFAMWVQDGKSELTIYDRTQDKRVFTVGRYGRPYFLQFTPDGTKILAQREFVGLDMWDVGTAKLLSSFFAKDRGSSVALAPSGKIAVQGMHNGDVLFLDIDTGKELVRHRAHTDYVHQVVISPDGTLAATGGADKTIHLWDVPNRKRLRVLTGHTSNVYRLCFTADGQSLVSGGGDNTVKWWATNASGPVATLPFPEHQEIYAWAWCKDSERMLVATVDRRSEVSRSQSAIELWNTSTGTREKVIGMQGRRVTSLALSPDERWLVSGSNDHTVKLWDMRAGKEVRTHFTPYTGDLEPWQEGNVYTATFTPDGSKYIIGKGDGTVQVFDRETGNEVWKKQAVMPQHWTTSYNGKQRMGEPVRVMRLECPADGRRLLVRVAGWGHGLFVWDAADGATRYETEDLSGWSNETPSALTADGNTLYTVGDRQDGTLYAVDLVAGKVVGQHKGFPQSTALAVSPDGKTVAVGGEEKSSGADRVYMIQLFDTATQKITAKLKSHEGSVTSLAFVVDPTPGAARPRLVSGSWDHTVKIWDPQTGQELLSLPLSDRNADRVEHLLVSPDGLRVAGTNSMDRASQGRNILRVWSARPQKQLPAIDPDQSGLTALERDMLVISRSLWVNEKPDAAWNALTAEERRLASGNVPWAKVVMDIQPLSMHWSNDAKRTHVILPKYYKPGSDEPSSMTLWGGCVEEGGKRYLRLKNRDEKEYRIEFELTGNGLRMKGRFYWFEPGRGITMAPWVFDGEYNPVPRE